MDEMTNKKKFKTSLKYILLEIGGIHVQYTPTETSRL